MQKNGYIDINLHSIDGINDAVISDPLELFFQEVELSVKTFPGEIWNCKTYIDINRYIFNKYVSITQIRNEVTYYIENNCPSASNFNWNVVVQLINGDNGSDLVYIEVGVKPNGPEDSVTFVNKYILGASK